ncbi:Unknown protein sequence [Pseudomonas syringae pv. maculicola]|nr:Unknown protein sequence [Pseudomonas syringae pv. maculicola]
MQSEITSRHVVDNRLIINTSIVTVKREPVTPISPGKQI